MTSNEDQFQYWLMDMDDAIQRFFEYLPREVYERLDYSPESLVSLEAWILDEYESLAAITKPSEARVIDGAARYIGQVFRKALGGKWTIDFSEKNNAYYGLPQIAGMAGQSVQECPLTLVTAASSRRKGNYIKMVFDSFKFDSK